MSYDSAVAKGDMVTDDDAVADETIGTGVVHSALAEVDDLLESL